MIKNNLQEEIQDEKVQSLLTKINELKIKNINIKTEIQEYKLQYYSFFLQAIEEQNEKIDEELLKKSKKKYFCR